ncbi:SWEET sugar transporter [Tanacetum coccineum]
MPILLSVTLTLSEVMWLFYGLLLGDNNIEIILYFVYKNKRPVIDEKISKFDQKISEMEEQKMSKLKDQKIVNVVKLNAYLHAEILPVAAKNANNYDHVAFKS